MPRLVIPNYTVIRDTREKEGHGWLFEAHDPSHRTPRCLGTIVQTLKTGDYTLQGYEHLLTIDRKQDFCELWVNYGERERFEQEMERMTQFKYRFVLVESHLTPEILSLSPPQFRVGVPGKAMTQWLVDLSIEYGVHIMPVGSSGRKIAQQVFHSVVIQEKGLWVPQASRKPEPAESPGSIL
jgi:hypothetical protein